ncbi:MAG TPA: glycosyltransferase family 4 protein [Balneolales bacterium]|nr:glycosyltransferase family 4 protein [Balneolales bacterium]
MKILHLLPYIPVPANFGGALRIYHVLKYLAENYDVTVVGFDNTGDRRTFFRAFPELQGRAHFVAHPWKPTFRKAYLIHALLKRQSFWRSIAYSKKMQKTLNRILTREKFDMVLSEFPVMGFFDLPGEALKILDAHNVEYDNFRRMATLDNNRILRSFFRREYQKFYGEELDVCKKQDAIFTTSYRDLELFHRDVPGIPKYVIPNGVDTSFFYPSDDEPEPLSMVFVGMMNYVPNYDGMQFFIDQVFPLIQKQIPGIKIYIVGKNPPKKLANRSSENIIVTDFVDDVRPYVWRSSVYVVPLRMGGGTRLKVLEALSMEKAVVTTHIGSEGIDVRDGDTVLIADNAPDFANAVIRLLNDRALRKKLGEAGRKLVTAEYEWEIITRRVGETLSNLLQGERQPAGDVI